MNKMSEDEAIEIMLDNKKEYERIIKELDDVRDTNDNKPIETIQDCQKIVQAIETILDLYQQEKNKSYNTAYSSGKAFENHRWKEKIREKIKEINNRRIEDGQCELALHGFQREAKIEVLNELLEEN